MPGSSERSRWRVSRALAAAAILGTWLIPQNAPATIAEQRARLPPAAECAGENVAGVWRSHKYYPQFGDWSIFTLIIRRDPRDPSHLVGMITNRNWGGGSEDEEPPPCDQQRRTDWTVSMDGEGTIRNDNEIEFGGVGQWRLDQTHCNGGPWGYNLDRFSGVIDPSILEFQSVNNDGGREVNEPMVFRRIRCPPIESAEAPNVNPIAPDFYPGRRGGCGL